MKQIFIVWFALYICAAGCKQADNSLPFVENRLNKAWLQHIIRSSDSSYSKPYFRSDFVTAHYYISKKDSTRCQVMRDSSERVRQIIIEKNNIRSFYAQYYPNGQAIAIIPLDSTGRFSGEATLFYPGGQIKSKGKYNDGLYSGVWETYNEEGMLVKKEEYGFDGQMLNSTHY